MRKIADSTIRRLSLYLRFLEELAPGGPATVSSGELAGGAATTSVPPGARTRSISSTARRTSNTCSSVSRHRIRPAEPEGSER